MLEAKFFFSLMSESEAFLVANLLTRSSLTPFMSALFSFKYAFVWFSFCRATARSCDVLYLHLSPLLLSSFFSLFKLLYFFLISFFLTQLNSTCSDISQNFIVSHTLMAIAGNVFTNRQSCFGIF